MRRIEDGAAEFVVAAGRIFGAEPRVLDGSRAVLIGDLKLSLEAGERELWLIETHGCNHLLNSRAGGCGRRALGPPAQASTLLRLG